jgi:hypothetical protein
MGGARTEIYRDRTDPLFHPFHYANTKHSLL